MKLSTLMAALAASVLTVALATPADAKVKKFRNLTTCACATPHATVELTARRKKHRKARRHRGGSSVSLSGIVAPQLIAKVREITAACGSRVISARSHRPNRSNHPIGRAVDMQGNPRCIYAHLKGWPGGVSTDYGRAQHVHISYNPGGQEWGLRFAHRGGGHTRTASRHRGRAQYAEAASASPQPPGMQ